MNRTTFDMERSIARCRVLLSIAAMVAVFIDPTKPALTRWLPLTGGTFVVSRYCVAVLLAHLGYGLTLLWAQSPTGIAPDRLARIATIGDVAFGAAIALVTESETSLFFVFFAFAVLTAGLRSGLRAAMTVTTVSIVFYLVLTVLSATSNHEFYVMRAAYLAMTGYLVGYLGQQRLNLERRIRLLEANAQRERIARSLHDGYAQALAAVNLRIETCQELFRRGRLDEAVVELAELQTGVNREHDELRTYIRSLVERGASPEPALRDDATRFTVRADFAGSATFVEHALQIMLEGIRNVRRHARASVAAIEARTVGNELLLAIDDDGVGFADGTPTPWAIASRVAEFSGVFSVRDEEPGGHLRIRLPAS